MSLRGGSSVAYQFVHMEIYSRKGRDGRGVDFILGEAERRPDACLHVAAPMPPETVFGVDIGMVRRHHDERAQAAVVTLANGKQRAIRKDQNTLVTVVASHPETMDAVRSNPAVAKAVKDWEALTVRWLRERYGDQLVSVIRHVDESHPHLHAYVLPDDPELRAGRLHPGQEAKRAIVAAGPVDGEDGKAVNRRGDAAYRQSMRDWQDSYWNAVGLPSGLTRLGPGRRRLTRDEWQAEKTQVQAVRAAQAKIARLEASADAFITKTRSVADAAIQKARDESAELRAAVMTEQVAAKRMHDEAQAKLRTAQSLLRRAKRDGNRILQAARSEGDRLRSFGARIRFFWDGLRRSAIEARACQSVAKELDRQRQRAIEANRRAIEEARKRKEAEQAREVAIAAVHAVGRERDAIRRRLAALVPDDGPDHFMKLKPRGTK